MEVRVTASSTKYGEREGYKIEIDGEVEFYAMDGESEDNSLDRNFCDIYDIPKLMSLAYDAGTKQEPMTVTQQVADWEEF